MSELIAKIRANHEQEVAPNGHSACRVCGSGDECDVKDVLAYADRLEGALKTARHSLVTLHNLTATDLPDIYDDEISEGNDGHGARDAQLDCSWVIDERKAIAEIDAVLAAPRQPGPAESDRG